MIWFQVPLLLGIGEEDTALTKATESGDTDLVYLVLFHIWQKVLLKYTSISITLDVAVFTHLLMNGTVPVMLFSLIGQTSIEKFSLN